MEKLPGLTIVGKINLNKVINKPKKVFTPRSAGNTIGSQLKAKGFNLKSCFAV